MFALSQKNLKSDLLSLSERGITQSHKYGELVQKSKESKLLIIFFGLDLTYLFSIEKEFNSEGEEVDMFIVSHLDSHISIDENLISSYDSILILDTSKAEVTYSRELAQTVLKTCSRTLFLGRKSSDLWSTVNVDQPEIDPSEVVNRWRQLGKE